MDKNYFGAGNHNYTGEMVKQASPFDRLSEAVTEVQEITRRARELADRIAGPQAETSASNLKEIGGGGLIDGLERQIGYLGSAANDLSSALSRIEGRL